MNPSSIFLFVFLILVSFSSWLTLADKHIDFLQCLISSNNTINPNLIYTQKRSTTSYFKVLNYSIRNPIFNSPVTPKPFVIVTPTQVSHIQTVVVCAKRHGVQIRIRSNGHDYEGLSYLSGDGEPFVVLDLIEIRSVKVNVRSRRAWVESGATLGTLYYRIAEKSQTLGFPAGVCNTVGIGGHFGGGGYGSLMRKYGLAADQVVDALIVNADGLVLDRKSMGEDLFWAIRGGGASSFGVVVAWKVRLVPVPKIVTVFSVPKNLSQNATSLIHRWQQIADKFDKDLFIRLIILTTSSTNRPGDETLQVFFNSLFLGGIDRLMPLMRRSFPELGLRREDCTEMSWIESVMSLDGLQGRPLEILLDRNPQSSIPFKAKSDYVTNPIPTKALEGIWERLFEAEVGRGILIMSPYGGKMSEISKSEIPFPHRAGNIFKIQYLIFWEDKKENNAQTRIDWIRGLYSYMKPYVSQNPRSAYLNYRDLDIGKNNYNGSASCAEASVWGTKYFNNNFERLVWVKTMVDPTNFFRNEQSIPSLLSV